MKEDKTCQICGKVFTRRNYMLKHMKHIHSKRYSCEKCGRLFSGPTKHSCAIPNGRFLCSVPNCNLKFSNGMALRLHIRDGHRKIDVNRVGEVVKTKKGIRSLMQNLCKRINHLNIYFNELKYKVDMISDFLSTKDIGYQFENFENVKGKFDVLSESESEEIYEDVEYIDDEYDDVDGDDGSEQVLDVPKLQDPIIVPAEDLKEVVSEIKTNVEIKTSASPPTCESKQPPLDLDSIAIQNPNFLETDPVFMSSTSTLHDDSFSSLSSSDAFIENIENKYSLSPASSSMDSSINAPISKKVLNFHQSNINLYSAAIQSTKNDSPTPSLFLNVDYDTQTNFCTTTDEHSIFNFNTNSPYEMQE